MTYLLEDSQGVSLRTVSIIVSPFAMVIMTVGCAQKPSYTEDRGLEVLMVVDTPQGRKAGAAVYHRWEWNEKSPIFGGRAGGKFVAEAIPVELGDGRIIFMTLAGRTGSGPTYGQSVPWNGHAADKLRIGFPGWVKVPQDDWPSIAIFDQPGVPSSIRRIVPEDYRSLGDGYSIRSISVRNTRKPPTRQIYRYLPWLRKVRNNMDGSRITQGNTFAGTTSGTDFVRDS
jgi:hypothetical protein